MSKFNALPDIFPVGLPNTVEVHSLLLAGKVSK